VQLLQRSLARGRLAHAYLFAGHHLDDLEALARTLAKTLNCLRPWRSAPTAPATDCCDACAACRKIDDDTHPDVFAVRPEKKSRQIGIGQVTRRDDSPARVLLDVVYLKPTEAQYKVCLVVAADRMTAEAANAFLKTLEEPPPRSVLILLTTDPARILETIESRCLRLNFGGAGRPRTEAGDLEWLARFSELASADPKSLLQRYRLLDLVLGRLQQLRDEVEQRLTERSPGQRYEEADEALRERWQKELEAAIEAEYRRRRAELLGLVQWWLRDVWWCCLGRDADALTFPKLTGAARLAGRLTPRQAVQNLVTLEETQRLLHTNVQEPLALEVGLLKLEL